MYHELEKMRKEMEIINNKISTLNKSIKILEENKNHQFTAYSKKINSNQNKILNINNPTKQFSINPSIYKTNTHMQTQPVLAKNQEKEKVIEIKPYTMDILPIIDDDKTTISENHINLNMYGVKNTNGIGNLSATNGIGTGIGSDEPLLEKDEYEFKNNLNTNDTDITDLSETPVAVYSNDNENASFSAADIIETELNNEDSDIISDIISDIDSNIDNEISSEYDFTNEPKSDNNKIDDGPFSGKDFINQELTTDEPNEINIILNEGDSDEHTEMNIILNESDIDEEVASIEKLMINKKGDSKKKKSYVTNNAKPNTIDISSSLQQILHDVDNNINSTEIAEELNVDIDEIINDSSNTKYKVKTLQRKKLADLQAIAVKFNISLNKVKGGELKNKTKSELCKEIVVKQN